MNDELARRIDAAHDAGDEATLQECVEECRDRLKVATNEQRVLLRYYEANSHAGIYTIRSVNPDYKWKWEESEVIAEVLALRQAIKEPAFCKIDNIFRSRILTNLGKSLNTLGRPVAAIEQWEAVLRENPKFAMALGNRAYGISYYARQLYDRGHARIMLAVARSSYSAALSEKAEWDKIERSHFKPRFQEEKNIIDAVLKDGFDDGHALNRWPLGDDAEEQRYRQWCLDKKLFLNPLNDALNLSVAATDVLHLPDHIYRSDEPPRFVSYFNLLKQEYVGSRYLLYRAMNEKGSRFVNRDVLLLDAMDGSVYGHHVEELKLAFRSAYAIFDKIGLFLNDYYDIGLNPGGVSFRRIWVEKPRGSRNHRLRQIFYGKRNWLLRGLYFLSKDLFDDEFKDVAEPDAAKLSDLRNQIEHRFLSLQLSDPIIPWKDDSCRSISIGPFQENALRMLRMAREALIYLSLAMHREEKMRYQQGVINTKTIPTVKSRRIDVDDLF